MRNKPSMCKNCGKIEWDLVDDLCKECYKKEAK